ncbi:hypothetical protein [Serratia sp. DD3]|uniref:hypothetical protein n=1 Tax=Serratia sp. DD3 TaxID=1410619 RepID=UPI00056A525C|nr:hypothetical protein [Serratia sp. DD3]
MKNGFECQPEMWVAEFAWSALWQSGCRREDPIQERGSLVVRKINRDQCINLRTNPSANNVILITLLAGGDALLVSIISNIESNCDFNH